MTKAEREKWKDYIAEKIIVNADTGCWEWQGDLNSAGYARGQANGKRRLVHRASYEAFNASRIPKGLVVSHQCDVRRCVNPAHLIAATQSENTYDAVRKGRHVNNQGSKHGMSKLTESDVHAIRTLREAGVLVRAVAARFGISENYVSDIANRRAWKHC